MNKEKFNAFWGTGDKLEFSTTAFSSHMPMFQDKLGANVNLVADFNFKDIKVRIGKDDADLSVDYTMGIDVSTLDVNGTKSASRFYDEIKMTTTANARAEDDVVYFSLLSNKVDEETTIGKKTQPISSDLSLSEGEYREFITTFGLYMNYLRKYLNNVYFKKGIRFPYNPKEIYTTLDFHPGSAHIFLDVAEEASTFFKKQYWDEKAK